MNENLNTGSGINIGDTVEIIESFPMITNTRIGTVEQIIPHEYCKSKILIKMTAYKNPLDISWLKKIK